VEKADWKKSPPELVEVFEASFPGPPAVARQMFGYRAAFVNGNLFMSLFEDRMVLRLPDGPRAELLAMEGAATFEPMAGRPMKEYVLVPASVLAASEALEAWVATALTYGGSLPAKAPKTKAPKTKAKARPQGAGPRR
jgi:TfoX/Sxy family transcriptional regulator of competence genes